KPHAPPSAISRISFGHPATSSTPPAAWFVNVKGLTIVFMRGPTGGSAIGRLASSSSASWTLSAPMPEDVLSYGSFTAVQVHAAAAASADVDIESLQADRARRRKAQPSLIVISSLEAWRSTRPVRWIVRKTGKVRARGVGPALRIRERGPVFDAVCD